MGIARATLVGNLTRDPDLRATPSGTSIANMRVAVNTRRKVGDEWQDVAGYYDVVVIGRRAETCAEHLSKGRQVAVDGRLQWREWTDKEGNKRQSVEILADEVQFIGGRSEGDSQPSREEETGGW